MANPADKGTGYLHADYAASLSEFGTPRHLRHCDAWVLERALPGGERDAMGPYPLFACRNWAGLDRDLAALAEDGLVSLVLVADPFGSYEPTDLERLFPDRLLAYKDHHVVDLAADPLANLAPHHRRNAQKALRSVEVEVCTDPPSFVDQWVSLYGKLIARHGISGVSAFSPRALAMQLQVPGIKLFRATAADGAVAGALLWYRQGDVAYYHLGAYNEAGYALGASFALFARAIEHFADTDLRWLDLGAGAGAYGESDGLSRFKRGWATGTRRAYLCGRIFDRPRYEELSRASGRQGSAYFPAYRAGEFA